MLLAAVLAGASTSWRLWATQRARQAASALDSLRTQLSAQRVPPAASAAPRQDFTASLPASASIDPIVRELQRASAAAGVRLVALDATARDSTPRTLGRHEIALTLRGDYPRLKAVLAEVLGRYPQLVLQRVSLHRLAAPTDVEASVGLLLLTRPLAASGPGG